MTHGLFSSVYLYFKAHGLRATCLTSISRLLDLAFDLRHRTDTYGWRDPGNLGLERHEVIAAEPYRPTHALPLAKVLKEMTRDVGEGVFLDVGSGKGRAMMLAGAQGFHVVRGVELSRSMANISIQNLSKFIDRRKANLRFEVLVQNASDYEFRDDETVVYLFNPFNRDSLYSSVMTGIERSLARAPRKLVVIYRAPQHRSVFDCSPYLAPAGSIRSWGQEFAIWHSRAPATQVVH